MIESIKNIGKLLWVAPNLAIVLLSACGPIAASMVWHATSSNTNPYNEIT